MAVDQVASILAPGGLLGRIYDRHGEKMRFLAVGAANTAFSYILFISLLAALGGTLHSLESSSRPLLALIGENYYILIQWIAWVFCVPVSTVTMKLFVFRSPGHWLAQVGRAYFVYLPAQGLNTLILWITVAIAHLPPQIGALVAIGVSTVASYIGHKYFTFRVPLDVGEVPPRDLIERG